MLCIFIFVLLFSPKASVQLVEFGAYAYTLLPPNNPIGSLLMNLPTYGE